MAMVRVCMGLIGVVASLTGALAADVAKGKTAYIQQGCWQCHDFAGEGASTSGGTVLARTALPLDAFKTFVRTTSGAMPPYRPALVSDDDLADIYAYLQSLPAPKPVSEIPLLNAARSK